MERLAESKHSQYKKNRETLTEDQKLIFAQTKTIKSLQAEVEELTQEVMSQVAMSAQVVYVLNEVLRRYSVPDSVKLEIVQSMTEKDLFDTVVSGCSEDPELCAELANHWDKYLKEKNKTQNTAPAAKRERKSR